MQRWQHVLRTFLAFFQAALAMNKLVLSALILSHSSAPPSDSSGCCCDEVYDLETCLMGFRSLNRRSEGLAKAASCLSPSLRALTGIGLESGSALTRKLYLLLWRLLLLSRLSSCCISATPSRCDALSSRPNDSCSVPIGFHLLLSSLPL